MNYFNGSDVAIFSDLHLGVRQNSPSWHIIASEWADWIVEDLKSKGIKDVIFPGDWFHARNEISVDTLHVGAKILEKFNDFKITMVVGNHDCYLKDRATIHSLAPYKNWQNVNVVDVVEYYESHGKTFGFVPWGVKASELKQADVIIGHFEINLFKMNTYMVCSHGTDPKDLLDKTDLVISGHFHLKDERKIGDGTILYVGNPFQMDFNDAGTQKGYYILNLDSLNYKFYENTLSPKHYHLYLSDLVEVGDFTDKIKKQIKNNFIKLRLDLKIVPDHVDILVNRIKSLQPRTVEVLYETGIEELLNSSEKQDFSGIEIEKVMLEVVEQMDINNKEQVYSKLIELYNKAKNETN